MSELSIYSNIKCKCGSVNPSEITVNNGDPNSGIDFKDTDYFQTRQLDYYHDSGVTTNNYRTCIKKGREISPVFRIAD